MGELVDHRLANLFGELVGIREVVLEREAEQRDLVRRGDRIGGPFRARRALVQAVQPLAAQRVLAQLVVARLVLDDDRHLAEALPERRRDAGQGSLDEALEAIVATPDLGGAMRAAAAAAALRHVRPILASVTAVAAQLDAAGAPAPNMAAEPGGFVVVVDRNDRIHFLDWGGPDAPDEPDGPETPPATLLIHGLSSTAWVWAPVARRLRRATRTVALDLRGHGLSDAPTTGYDRATLAGDAIAGAEGSRILGRGAGAVAGPGVGASVAAWRAGARGTRRAG